MDTRNQGGLGSNESQIGPGSLVAGGRFAKVWLYWKAYRTDPIGTFRAVNFYTRSTWTVRHASRYYAWWLYRDFVVRGDDDACGKTYKTCRNGRGRKNAQQHES